jgi:hypothetical protein
MSAGTIFILVFVVLGGLNILSMCMHNNPK